MYMSSQGIASCPTKIGYKINMSKFVLNWNGFSLIIYITIKLWNKIKFKIKRKYILILSSPKLQNQVLEAQNGQSGFTFLTSSQHCYNASCSFLFFQYKVDIILNNKNEENEGWSGFEPPNLWRMAESSLLVRRWRPTKVAQTSGT